MNRFRPRGIQSKYLIRERRLTGSNQSYNWQSRARWYPAGWQSNQQTLGRIFSQLHYLAYHAPQAVNKQWRRVAIQFENQHLARRGRSSVRFMNNHTARGWL